jgi:hypothetical protein
VAVREGWLPAAEFRMPNVETGRTAFESPVHISVAADSNTDSREFWNGGEGGITLPLVIPKCARLWISLSRLFGGATQPTASP